ncbi:MAG: ATP-binding protein, partial [candidate division FCPU426 bacterium]
GVRELKESVITDIYPVRHGTRVEPAQAVSAPIFRGKRLVGTLVGVMHLPSHMQETLMGGVFGKDSAAYLVSEEGVALAHTDLSKLFKDFSGHPEVIAALKDSEGVVRYRRADSTEMLAAFARVESATWSVVLSQPLKDAYEPAARALKWLILYLAGCLLLLAAASGYIAQRVVSPLVELTGQVRRQDWKQLASAVPGKRASHDEVGLLAEALSGMARDLEEQRKQRELAHQRALDAERLLAERERLASIGQLAAGLAHELNNPLTVISGAAEMAVDSSKADLKRWMDSIGKESRRCKRLITDLLDFAKPLHLKTRDTDLQELVKEAWEQSVMGATGALPCKLLVKGRAPRLKVDAERLKQVFLNLFSNAREAGASEVQVSFKKLRSAPDSQRVEVLDDGPGLGRDPEKLFRPFFTRRAGGTGLGLPIARMVVQAHGGRLWGLKSTRKRGAHFIFELPLKAKGSSSAHKG